MPIGEPKMPEGYMDTTPYVSLNPDFPLPVGHGTKFSDASNRRGYMIANIQEVLEHIAHIDPTVEHTKRTAERFYDSLVEMCTPEPFEFTTFESASDEMVTLGPIPFYTLCAHHVVPFYGNVWIGYVPDNLIAGLSKIPRAVKYVAKGLWVQEDLTGEIASFLNAHLQPKGVAVVMKAEHLCMAMRGVEQPGVLTTTAKMTGVFGDHTRTAKAEFMEWIRG